MKKNQVLIFLFSFAPFLIMAQQSITGKVIDKTSKAPLSYSSIAVPNSTTGTMTDADGSFELLLKEGQNKIQISYIGYLDTTIIIDARVEPYTITLRPYEYQLSEVIVKPLSPLEYIQKALIKHPSLIPSSPFLARSFFAAKSSLANDNNDAYELNEAVFNTYYSDFSNDTLQEDSQLILYRKTTQGEFTSMLEENKRLMRKTKKQKNKSKSLEEDTQGEEEAEEEEGVTFSLNGLTNSGPAAALKEAKTVTTLDFFNEEYFKKFAYTFGDQTYFQGRELIRIDFSNKRKVEHTFFNGSIYLDHQDLAIVAVEYNEKVKIPGYINLLLKTLAGFSIDGLERDVMIRNQFLDKWYPKDVIFDLKITIKQKKKLEVISVAQILNIEDISTTGILPIATDKVFDDNLEYKEQIHLLDGISWDKVNVIQFK